MQKVAGEYSSQGPEVAKAQVRLLELHQQLLPKYGANWHRHSLVALKVEALSRLLYYSQLYQQIIEVPGVICEFGVHWGATMTELINLRSIYEPFNYSRTIVGFDTFEGFPSVSKEDGAYSEVGDHNSIAGYEAVLDEILRIHEQAAPVPHIKKFELVKGDASVTIDSWLRDNPHALISMAIFDMDIYEPTLTVLKKIEPCLVKGSLLVFDELNCKHFPGETIALREFLDERQLKLRRTPMQTFCAWAVWGE